jgi:hypothetical protein
MDELPFLERIKKLVIIAMFSDDDLLQRLVLKGGNLLDVVFNISSRASMDLDFSIEGQFETAEQLHEKIARVLNIAFDEVGYVLLDLKVVEAPPILSADMKDFWGGYQIEFKIIERNCFTEFKAKLAELRKRALPLGRRRSPKFQIDISKHEYCEEKRAILLDGYTIYTYSPEMMVAEKLRAICQQMPEYARIVMKHASARARDFVDIHDLIDHFSVSVVSKTFRHILLKMFDIKRVPISLIGRIATYREFHRPDFVSVKETVKPQVNLNSFDFYFDYVIEKTRLLESLWNE